MITTMRKNIKEAITSTVTDMIKADLEVSDELVEYIEIAEIIKNRKNSKTISFDALLKKENINFDDL